MIETSFTQIPNRFLDRQHELNRGEVILMLCVYRNTLGYHRQRVPMTITEMEQRTGLSRQGVLDARQQALEHGLLSFEVKGGLIFWEPVLETTSEAVKSVDPNAQTGGLSQSNPLTAAVKAVDYDTAPVKSVDSGGQTGRPPESTPLTAAVKSVDHDPAAIKPFDPDGQISRPLESNRLTEAVKSVDPLLNKDSNKDLKKEREGKTARPVFEDDFNFELLMPRDYRKVPELALYQKVTKLTPGTLQLNEIVRAIRTHQLTEAHLTECWRNWAILNGYRVGNLAWLVEWAPRFKAGERPWERKSNGSGASGRVMGRDAPALKNTVRPEDILADLEAK
jgi:hypothetical protein